MPPASSTSPNTLPTTVKQQGQLSGHAITSSSPQWTLIPKPILSFLKDRLNKEPDYVESAKSAQQVVLILHYAESQPEKVNDTQSTVLLTQRKLVTTRQVQLLHHDSDDNVQNHIIRKLKHEQTTQNKVEEEGLWNYALQCGNNHLVVRYWQGGSRWWNLNRKSAKKQQQQGTMELAKSELAAYQIAHLVLGDKIPRLLHYSHDDTIQKRQQDKDPGDDNTGEDLLSSSSSFSWAILEYVGPEADRFSSSSSSSPSSFSFDSYWMESMVKIRDEFGFSEPHPRWGRVSVDQCLQYALTILWEVTIPLHQWFFQQQQHKQQHKQQNREAKDGSFTPQTTRLLKGRVVEDLVHELGIPARLQQQLIGHQQHRLLLRQDTKESASTMSENGYTFGTLVNLYQQAHQEMTEIMMQQQQPQQQIHSIEENDKDSNKLVQAIRILGKCVLQLEQEMQRNEHVANPLPFVLVHMDCQPQNLIFARSTHHGKTLQRLNTNNNDDDDENKNTPQRHSSLHVSSVLDWEEAAFADPRFELVLLGRKVCANEEQAKHLWYNYQEAFGDYYLDLGTIDPWLRLETVHSLSTLLLQSLNHEEYGRSPWETKPDLWGKISREFQRLARAGWTFCACIE